MRHRTDDGVDYGYGGGCQWIVGVVLPMVIFAWIVAGALLGGAASALNGSPGRAAFALNVAVGVAGVMLGGWLLGVLIGAAAFGPGVFGLGSLLVSLMGASVLLTVPHVFRRAGDTGHRHATAALPPAMKLEYRKSST